MSAGIRVAFEPLDEESRKERLQRFQNPEVCVLVVVAPQADAVLVTDELLPSVGVVEDQKLGLGQLGTAVEYRTVGRDPERLTALDRCLICRIPVLGASDQESGRNAFALGRRHHLTRELLGRRGVDDWAFGLASHPLADEQAWQRLACSRR